MKTSANIIAVSNHKGGVGKTTSVINIGAGLAKLDKKVLLIDLDAQANLTQSLGVKNPDNTIYETLIKKNNQMPIKIIANLDLIPSTIDISGLELELSKKTSREFILKRSIENFTSLYHFILIDCPPSLSLLTINALTVSNEVYIPLQAQYLALQGLTKLIEVIEKVKKSLNKALKIGGIFITQFDKRKILHRDVAESIENHFKERVLTTKIRDNIALAEAPARGQDIFRYNAKCNGSKDYLSLAKEILKRNK